MQPADLVIRGGTVMEPVARACGRPNSISLIQNLTFPDQWRDVLHRTERARATGAPIVPQVAARTRGSCCATTAGRRR